MADAIEGKLTPVEVEKFGVARMAALDDESRGTHHVQELAVEQLCSDDDLL